MIKSKNCEMYN